MTDSVMSTQEAAELLGISPRQVINLITRGDLAGQRLGPYRGGQWVVVRSSALALKAKRDTDPPKRGPKARGLSAP